MRGPAEVCGAVDDTNAALSALTGSALGDPATYGSCDGHSPAHPVRDPDPPTCAQPGRLPSGLRQSRAHRRGTSGERPLEDRLPEQAHLDRKIEVCPRAVGGEDLRRRAAQRQR